MHHSGGSGGVAEDREGGGGMSGANTANGDAHVPSSAPSKERQSIMRVVHD